MRRRSFILFALLTLVFAPGLGMAQADKVKTSMAALMAKTGALGAPKIEGVEPVGGKEAPALYFGSTKMNNSFDLVDAVAKEQGGVVTLFVQLYDSSPEAVKSEIATFFQVFPDGIIAGNTFRGVGYDTVLLGQAGPIRIDLDAIEARLQRADFTPVVRSLKEIGLAGVVDLFGTYAGRASDLSEWLRTASINRDGDLRLQYVAGLGLNMNESDAVYSDILKYRRFPEGLFTGSPGLIEPLRERIGSDQR